MRPPVLVMDNGASSIKIGLAEENAEEQVVPNAVVRSKGDKATYIGHEMSQCKDYSSLHFRIPFEKGFVTDWDAEKAIWDGLLTSNVLPVGPEDASLLITEPYFNLPNIQEVYDQFVFEEYEFQSYHRCAPTSYIPYGMCFAQPGLPPPECMIVVDSGFSFTHVVPIMAGEIVWDAVLRLDVGGKLLTNQLKELMSFRQWNMMEETFIVNQIKEACCFVSLDFRTDLEICQIDPKKNAIVQEYVLPDLSINRRGHIREPDEILADADQVVYMNNERFAVPEILFRPDDIGMNQCGLADLVAASIMHLPADLRGLFWANIGLVGGNTRLPGFRQRLMKELRSLAPVECDVNIYECDDPIMEPYRAACAFARTPGYWDATVSRTEYLEGGSNACRRKFRGSWRPPPPEDPKGKGRAREEGAVGPRGGRRGRGSVSGNVGGRGRRKSTAE